ncbi:MAG: hypothetical protein CL908_19080 [Deltaproteobacteria bacterium]|nr:hypothetical protein [Deltaproteobacteria bacterium]
MSVPSILDRLRGCRIVKTSAQLEADEALPWIGVDFSDSNDARSTTALLPLLVVALVSALGVAALRIDLIRTRYAMSTAMTEEKSLIEEQRALIVRRRQLRDPVELAIQAHQRGFRPSAHVLTLPEPLPPFHVQGPKDVELPAVAAGPGSANGGQSWR